MFTFPLHDNEEIVGMYRTAEILLARYVFLVFFAIYLPLSLLIQQELLYVFRWYILTWTLVVLAYAIHAYLTWLLNVTLITNQRVIKVSHKSLLSKEVQELPLAQIQKIGYRRKGLLPALFNYGDIELFSLGSEHPLTLAQLKQPEQLKQDLWKLLGGRPQA